MKQWSIAALILGLGAVVGLVLHEGAGAVATALAAAGWGLWLVVAYRIVPMTVDTLGWRLLFERRYRPPYRRLLWVRWIGDGVNWLLPVLQVGGELVKTRLLTFYGVPGRVGGASVVVDLTIGVFTQLLFTLCGVALLLVHYGDYGSAVVGRTAAVGLLVAAVAVGLFYVVQRRGLFRSLVRIIETLARGRDWMRLVGGAEALDATIASVYKRRRQLLVNGFWQLLAWVAGTGEVWLALRFMGSPVSVIDALLIESLAQALRAAGFLVPGALGVQEGGLMLIGGALGIGPDVALALSLVKRVREITIGVPGIVYWQALEARRLLRRRKAERAETEPPPRGS